MFDLLLILMGLVGVVYGTKIGFKQTSGIFLSLLVALVISLLVSSLAALVVPGMFGGNDYVPRALSLLGAFLLVASYGTQYALNKTARLDKDEKELHWVTNRLLGLVSGFLAAQVALLFIFFVGVQLPVFAEPLSEYFLVFDDESEEGGSLFQSVTSGLSSVAQVLPRGEANDKSAPDLVVLVGGASAGDFYACYINSFRGVELDDFSLYLNLGGFIYDYSLKETEVGSPWLSSAVETIQILEEEKAKEIVRKSKGVFIEGSIGDMEALLTALNVVPSNRFKRLKDEGELLKRTVGWAIYYQRQGDPGKAGLVLGNYLKAYPGSPYRARIILQQDRIRSGYN